jgi:hypothetical protein
LVENNFNMCRISCKLFYTSLNDLFFKRESSEDSLTQKQDLTTRAKNITLEIVEAYEERVKIKSNCAGHVKGSLYSGSYNDTVEAIMMPDGTLALIIRYLHITNRGEAVWGTGKGTRGIPDAEGIAKLNAEGTMWTFVPRLS